MASCTRRAEWTHPRARFHERMYVHVPPPRVVAPLDFKRIQTTLDGFLPRVAPAQLAQTVADLFNSTLERACIYSRSQSDKRQFIALDMFDLLSVFFPESLKHSDATMWAGTVSAGDWMSDHKPAGRTVKRHIFLTATLWQDLLVWYT